MTHTTGKVSKKGILIVGYGPRGRVWKRVIDKSRETRVIGVVDPDPSARSVAAAEGLECFRELAAALDTARADGIIIASPPDLHPAHAIACKDSGARLLIEKPLATSLRTAIEIVETGDERRLVLVCQNFRYLRREIIVRRLVRDGAIGVPHRVTISSARTSASAPRHVEAIAHGPLWDFSIHHFDAILDRFATQASLIRAEAEDNLPGRVVYTAHAQLDNGVAVDYEHVEGAPYAYSEHIEGDRGAITVDHQKVKLTSASGRSSTIGWGHLVPDRFAPSPDRAILKELSSAIDGAHVPIDARTNLPAIALLDGASRSLISGGEVAVEDVAGRMVT